MRKLLKPGQVWFNTEQKDYLRIISVNSIEIAFRVKTPIDTTYSLDVYELSVKSFNMLIKDKTLIPYGKSINVLF